jgi:hypothetical protein
MIMNDLKKFQHGEEGTHHACQSRIDKEGMQSRCCSCVPHEGCDINDNDNEVPKYSMYNNCYRTYDLFHLAESSV